MASLQTKSFGRPLISVVVPTFNRAHKLPTAVRSVLSQTVEDLELVIVDDGSTDDTRSLLADLARQDVRVRPLRLACNSGAPAARNAGVAAARGAWIALVDSDDELLPDSLEVRLGAARTEGAEVVTSDWYTWHRDQPAPALHGVDPLRGDVYRRLLRGPATGGAFVSSSAMRSVMPLDERLVAYQEWDLAIALARRYRFACAEVPTFIWDQRAADTISSDPRREARGYERVIVKRRFEILSKLGPKGLAGHYKTLSELYLRAGSSGASRRCAHIAVMLWPVSPKVRSLVSPRWKSAGE